MLFLLGVDIVHPILLNNIPVRKGILDAISNDSKPHLYGLELVPVVSDKKLKMTVV